MRKLFALLSLALVLGGCLPTSEDTTMEEENTDTPAIEEEAAVETPATPAVEETTEETAE